VDSLSFNQITDDFAGKNEEKYQIYKNVLL